MKKYFLIVFFVIVFFPQQILSAFYSGNQLKIWLDSSDRVSTGNYSAEDIANNGMLLGYVAGVYDSVVTYICPADGILLRQVIAVVKKYINDNPESWNQSADILIKLALERVFPCKDKFSPIPPI